MYVKILSTVVVLFALTACKADRVIVDVDQGEIERAIAGEVGEAEFTATFEFSGELDNRRRSMLEEIEQIVRRDMIINEFLISGDGRNTQVEIEGFLPVASSSNSNAPWYLRVEPYGNDRYIVSVAVGTNYSGLRGSIRNVRSDFAPDAFHPTTIRYRGDGSQITVPAGFVEGEPKVMWSDTINGRISMRFAGGIFDDVGGAFLYQQ